MACALTKETSPRTAETDQSRRTRETQPWLALSRRGDVSEDLLETEKVSKKSKCLNFPRLPGDVAETSPQPTETRVAT